MRSEFLSLASMKTRDFWDVMPCSLIELHHFRGTCSLCLHHWRAHHPRRLAEIQGEEDRTWLWDAACYRMRGAKTSVKGKENRLKCNTDRDRQRVKRCEKSLFPFSSTYEGWNFNFGNTPLDWTQELLEWRANAAGRMGPSPTYIHNRSGPSWNGHMQ